MMLKNLARREKFPNFQTCDYFAERESTGKTNLFNKCEMIWKGKIMSKKTKM